MKTKIIISLLLLSVTQIYSMRRLHCFTKGRVMQKVIRTAKRCYATKRNLPKGYLSTFMDLKAKKDCLTSEITFKQGLCGIGFFGIASAGYLMMNDHHLLSELVLSGGGAAMIIDSYPDIKKAKFEKKVVELRLKKMIKEGSEHLVQKK